MQLNLEVKRSPATLVNNLETHLSRFKFLCSTCICVDKYIVLWDRRYCSSGNLRKIYRFLFWRWLSLEVTKYLSCILKWTSEVLVFLVALFVLSSLLQVTLELDEQGLQNESGVFPREALSADSERASLFWFRQLWRDGDTCTSI